MLEARHQFLGFPVSVLGGRRIVAFTTPALQPEDQDAAGQCSADFAAPGHTCAQTTGQLQSRLFLQIQLVAVGIQD